MGGAPGVVFAGQPLPPSCPLANYQPYIGLEEWENRTRGLADEVLPTKRCELRDYFRGEAEDLVLQGVAGGASAASYEGVDAFGPIRTPLPSSPGLAAGPAFSARLGRPPSSPPLDATSWETAAAGAAAPTSSESSMGGDVKTTPRILAPRRRVCLPKLGRVGPRSFPSASEVHWGGVRETAAPIHAETLPSHAEPLIKVVHPSAVNGIDYVSPGAPRKVRSSEPHMKGREMRPAREKNTRLSRRLQDLLKCDNVRIGASDKHPSRTFEAVPQQNLRVE